MDEYPCDCKPGKFLCKEAERLWRESIAYSSEGDWGMYDVKRGEYDHLLQTVMRWVEVE